MIYETFAKSRYLIILGSHSTIGGKTIINTVTSKSALRKGKPLLETSHIVVSDGAKPFMVNRLGQRVAMLSLVGLIWILGFIL